MTYRGGCYTTLTKLLGNALGFRYHKLTCTPLKPEVVSLAVTNRCNSHCIMCNMWRLAAENHGMKSRELSCDSIIELLDRPLFNNVVEIDLTGGEPHLREDLVDIASGIIDLKKTRLPRLRTIVITSNGLLPERVISNYGKILERIRDTGIDLVTVASIDGIGKIHDAIRGTKNAFDLAVKTIDGLRELRKEHPDYFIGLKTTVLPQNIDRLDDILELACSKDLFHIISPVFFTSTRFRNAESKDELELGTGERRKLLDFYRRPELDNNYFYSRIRSFLASGHKCWSCTATFNYLFIEYDGTVYPCELLSEPLGNIKEQPIEEIWRGTAARNVRKLIGKTEQCRNCIEPGAVRYSACAEGSSYSGFLRGLGRHKYRKSLDGEGYHKYLE